MNLDPKVVEALRDATETIRKRHPALYAIMERTRLGEISETEALDEMLRVAQEDIEGLTVDFMAALAPIAPDQGEVQTPPGAREVFYSGVGLPKLNPLFEAALIERAQFDGDMPELRTGPLPPGVKPAVSVETTARDPAAIGAMLIQASAQVHERIIEHEQKRLGPLAQDAREDIEALTVLPDVGPLVWGSQGADLAQYRRGEVPAPVKVAAPTGSDLARMDDATRRRFAWKALSTTQGRRSVVPVIRGEVLAALRARDLSVDVISSEAGGEIVAHHEWVVVIAGQNTNRSNVASLDLAAKCLTAGLLRGLGAGQHEDLHLVVAPVNTVVDRRVGWSAHLEKAHVKK